MTAGTTLAYFSPYEEDLCYVYGEYAVAIDTLKAYEGWSFAYKDYLMFRMVLQGVQHLGIPPCRHGQSFRIGQFKMRDGSLKGVTIAQFVEGLGYNWRTWSSKSSLYFKIQDLLTICDKANETGRVVNDEVKALEAELRLWSQSDVPLFTEPSTRRKQSSKTLQATLTRVLVCRLWGFSK